MKKDLNQKNLTSTFHSAIAAGGAAAVNASQSAPVRYSQVLSLKRSGPEPLYYQLAQSIEGAVQAGTIRHGTKLPPIRAMAEDMNLAVQTVRTAWEYLERRGVLSCRPGVGTAVT